MLESIIYVGLDIAQKTFDLCIEGSTQTLPNTALGHRQLIKKLKEVTKPLHFICEATGGYEKQLVNTLQTSNFVVSVINPARVRHFARAKGRLAKTDPIDARILAEYGEVFCPRPTLIVSKSQAQLQELVSRRQQIIESITQEKNRTTLLGNPMLIRLAKRLLQQLQKQLEAIDQLISQLIETQPLLKDKIDKLCQIQGVGKTTAVCVLATMPELGSLTKRQTAALAGLAPMNRDSGSSSGHRFISGGRPATRRSLYMAALVAAFHNPILSRFYQRLCKKGKPKKVALTAVMRKLILLFNSILKNPNFSLAA